MKCDLEYCIYNRDYACILEGTQLNSLGMCDECIIVSIPSDDLNEMKAKHLSELEKRYSSSKLAD